MKNSSLTNDQRLSGRPKSAAKGEAILSAAGDLFLQEGVEDTTMDRIAERAGVSKQTVYSHFGNKEGLYEAVIRSKMQHYGLDSEAVDGHPTLREALEELARQFLDLTTDDEVVAMMRVLIAESSRNATTVSLFWRNGPERARRALAHRLAYWQSQGLLSIEDPDEEASLFFAALHGDHHLAQLMNRPVEWSEGGRNRFVRLVVKRFLTAWSMTADH